MGSNKIDRQLFFIIADCAICAFQQKLSNSSELGAFLHTLDGEVKWSITKVVLCIEVWPLG